MNSVEMNVTSTVSAIGKLKITGNVIPVAWLSNIVLPSGRADLKAIIILSEIIYWYRPREIRCEDSGLLIGYKKRFSADKLQRSYSSFTNLGMTKREAADAIKRLRDLGLVTLELRTITASDGNRLPNTLFIEPVVEGIEKATYSTLAENINEDAIDPPKPAIDVTPTCNTSHDEVEHVLRETGTSIASGCMTITEITTEITTETKNLDILSDSSESNVPAVIDDSKKFDAKAQNELKHTAFVTFYDVYQKKSGRKAAEKSFLKIKLPADRGPAIELIKKIIRQAKRWGDLYASAPADQKQFQPHPATWINNERWEDEELPTIRQGQSFDDSQALSIGKDQRSAVSDSLTNIHDTDW